MTEVDDFDFICHIAYGAKPLTRRERANNVKREISSANIVVQQEKFLKRY